jgi:cytochrome c oxidase subunit I+III
MSDSRIRTAGVSQRRPEEVEARPTSWWGMLLLCGVVITAYAAMAFTYVYVRVGSQDWPPAGIEPPELGLPALSVLALVASAVPVGWAARRAPAGAWATVRVALVVAILLAGLHIGLLIADWAAQPFTVDQHASASLYYALPGIHAVIVGLAAVIAAVVVALSWHEEGPPMVVVSLKALQPYWFTGVIGGVLLLAVVYVLPHVWPEAIAP